MRMEHKRDIAYLRAKKKVETLKGFYSHLAVYILVNTILIFISAGVFSPGKADFTDWGIYATAFFWGIGLVCHALYIFFVFHIKINFLKSWEEKKMQQFMEEDRF